MSKSGNQHWQSSKAKLGPSVFILLLVAIPARLASCNFPGILWVQPVYYTIGGTVSGLTGTGLVLRDNSGNNLPVSATATGFKFTVGIASGGSYNVTVFSQPSNPSQTCRVTNGSGPVTDANITSVLVTCTTDSFTIGGMISGLTGAGLVLQNNAGNNLPVNAGATSFMFTTPIASGDSYNVTVFSLPSNPSQTCGVADGSGPVTNANITSVQIACTENMGSLSINPPSVLVPFGWTQQFTVTISGGGPVPATWSVNGIVGGSALYGTISASGLYTAPDTAPTPSTVTVGAVDQADANFTGIASVEIVGLFAYVTSQGSNGATGGSLNAYSINSTGQLVALTSPSSSLLKN